MGKYPLTLGFLFLLMMNSHGQEGVEQPGLTLPARSEILSTLRDNHPRLIITEEDTERIKALCSTENICKRWYGSIIQDGNEVLTAEPSQYIIPDGKRLLATSREVLRRVYLLSFLYLMEDDNLYKLRLWKEIESVVQFPDWNPSHFLDTAEMTHALAIAYDWLYESWSTEEKEKIREAIVSFGLRPALQAYESDVEFGWWTTVSHNWNQVCNGGIAIGALAVADEEPELASRILHNAVSLLPDAIRHYGPDGAWNEGPGYWHYATRYTVYALASLAISLGTDFGLSEIEGFSEAGTFPIYMSGPTGHTFNFGDGSDRPITAEEMLWLAQRFNRPEFAAYQVSHALPSVLDLIWYDPELATSPLPESTLDFYYRGLEAVTMRTSWSDPDALFVGFKAGDNNANHSNLDIGSFVLEAIGERWVVDLGRDNYNLPGYFEKASNGRRWTYYRMRAESHNVFVVDPRSGPDQEPAAYSKITAFVSTQDHARAIANLTPAYEEWTSRAERSIELDRSSNRAEVWIEDKLQMKQPSSFWWFIHTPAEIQMDGAGRTATLVIEEKELQVNLQSPAAATFRVLDASPLPTSPQPVGQDPNSGIKKLAILLKDVESVSIRVTFTVK